MKRRIITIINSIAVAMAICIYSIQANALSPLSLKKGDIVRIESGGSKGKFKFIAIHNDSLVLNSLENNESKEMALADLDRLDIYRGPRSRSQGAGVGFIYGMLCGVSAGVVTGLLTADQSDAEMDILKLNRYQAAGLFGVAFGAVGGIIGSAIGLIHPEEEWEQVNTKELLNLELLENGEVQLGIKLRF